MKQTAAEWVTKAEGDFAQRNPRAAGCDLQLDDPVYNSAAVGDRRFRHTSTG